ncbi:ABC transporter ATP-binding protein [Dehalobacter sp. DCM]|uniref:ABC transporter ATP-binding protein n=1 Tax=Dehalobacter sp. DCM TaxID=2907827 RepID=UPI0030815708|nr:ABC transporter ATP-binding protein [Dehalobacter sp. DCM]
MTVPLIEVRHVDKTFYSDWGSVHALSDISFVCQEQECVSIVGPSGCGKTTLLRIIAGLEKESAGDVLIHGQRISGPGFDRAVVFQDPRLFPWLTVEKNVAQGIHGENKEAAVEIITKSLEWLGLSSFRKAYPNELSGGMAQRVALARALAFDPGLLLMDEPFSALDAQTRTRMQDDLVALWQQSGKTILFVTHDIEEALMISRRVIIMSPRPGSIREVLDVPFNYPRNQDDPDFIHWRKYILESIR